MEPGSDRATPVSRPHSAMSASREGGSCGDHIKVIVRARPANQAELKESEILTQSLGDGCFCLENNKVCFHVTTPETCLIEVQGKTKPYTFTFDNVFGQDSGQIEVFEAAGIPAVDNVLAGFNSTIFAYGQTGAGTTYTMSGVIKSEELRGLTPRVFEYLFQRIEEERASLSPPPEYRVVGSNLEIYNEAITDLMKPGRTNLQLRNDTKFGSGTYVVGLTEKVVRNTEQALDLMEIGINSRTDGSTNANLKSIRSHWIFTCVITRKHKREDGSESNQISRLNLVDLAGSERTKASDGKDAQALREGCNINKSLTHLGRVIKELVESQKRGRECYVPYRDSKLTLLLRESLGGNARTTIIAGVSPMSRSSTESLSTLRFVQRAKHIKNKAKANEIIKIEKMKKGFVAAGIKMDGEPDPRVQEEMQREEERCQELENQLVDELELQKVINEMMDEITTREQQKNVEESVQQALLALHQEASGTSDDEVSVCSSEDRFTESPISQGSHLLEEPDASIPFDFSRSSVDEIASHSFHVKANMIQEIEESEREVPQTQFRDIPGLCGAQQTQQTSVRDVDERINNEHRASSFVQERVASRNNLSTGSDFTKACHQSPVQATEMEVTNLDDPLAKIAELSAGDVFANRYLIREERIPGKPHIRFAADNLSSRKVVLKFYPSRECFDKCMESNSGLSPQYVCKPLDIVDDDRLGYPPCLVFERGDKTLSELMQTAPPDSFTKKWILSQVLRCLDHIHSLSVIHCDIKPANIMFFTSTHSWKLLDTDFSVQKGQPCRIHYTLGYASPEVMLAEDQEWTSINVEPSVDMWAFGVMAFEVLTGNRFYGTAFSGEVVKACLLGRQPLPSLDGVYEIPMQQVLTNLLQREPRQRWSARRVMDHAAFQSVEDTTMKETSVQQVASTVEDQIKGGLQPVLEEVNEVQGTVDCARSTEEATCKETCSENLMTAATIEKFVRHGDLSGRAKDRASVEAAILSEIVTAVVEMGGDPDPKVLEELHREEERCQELENPLMDGRSEQMSTQSENVKLENEISVLRNLKSEFQKNIDEMMDEFNAWQQKIENSEEITKRSFEAERQALMNEIEKYKQEIREFQPCNDDIIIFCKLFESDLSNVMYIGHLFVKQTISCSELLTRIVGMAKLPSGKKYSVFTEEKHLGVKEIANTQRSVAESGFYSGSIVMLVVPREAHEDISAKSVQQALLAINEKTPEASDNGSTDVSDDGRSETCESRGDLFQSEDGHLTGPDCIVDDHQPPLSALTDGCLFTGRYRIEARRIQGKPHVLFAVDEKSHNDRVVLKFYTSIERFNNSRELHARLSSDFVCRMLHVIEEEGFPPCLVFERGDDTLDAWMEKVRPDPLAAKAVLLRILNCISYLHSLRVIHCDLKPRNVMFFASTISWKLSVVDFSVKEGQPCTVHYTLMYASPEVVRAEEKGQTSITLESSVDMWSFGILAFEVLTGNKFYGPEATKEAIRSCLLGRQPMPSLDCVEETQVKTLLHNLLCTSPRKRWSASRALRHAMFQSVEGTTQEAAGIQQVREDLNKAMRFIQITLKESLSANLIVVIVIEEYVGNREASVALKDSAWKKVLTMRDDNMQDDPIFMLVVGRIYRLRVSLRHKHRSQATFRQISGVTAKAPDAEAKTLDIIEITPACNGHEVVALFNATEIGSDRLMQVSPMSGELEKKYVMLDVRVSLSIEEAEEVQSLLDLSGRVVCNMVANDALLEARRIVRWAREQWDQGPQWMRDGARGAIILAEVGKAATEIAAPGFGGVFWNTCGLLNTLLVLPCFRRGGGT